MHKRANRTPEKSRVHSNETSEPVQTHAPRKLKKSRLHSNETTKTKEGDPRLNCHGISELALQNVSSLLQNAHMYVKARSCDFEIDGVHFSMTAPYGSRTLDFAALGFSMVLGGLPYG